jgi:toxin ParE1/3/4
MALPVVYRQVARREIVNVARTYEGQRQGLGGLFLDEIGRIEAHISDGPRLYQIVVGGVRRAVLRRFPFGLFYLDEDQRIVVLACLDLRRDPETIVSTVATRRDR